MRVRITSKDDEMNGWLGPRELDELLELTSNALFSVEERGFNADFASDQTLAAAVSNPESLDPAVVVGMTEHLEILTARGVAVDEVDSRQNIPVGSGEELEDSAILPPNDNPTVDEGDRRWDALTAHLLGYIRNRVLQVPEGKSGIFGDGSERVMEGVEVESADSLLEKV